MQEGVPAPVAAGRAHAVAPRREALRLQRVRTPVRKQVQLAATRRGALGRKVWYHQLN